MCGRVVCRDKMIVALIVLEKLDLHATFLLNILVHDRHDDRNI